MCKFGTSQYWHCLACRYLHFGIDAFKNHFFCFTALRSRLNAVFRHIKLLEILHAKPITKILTCHKILGPQFGTLILPSSDRLWSFFLQKLSFPCGRLKLLICQLHVSFSVTFLGPISVDRLQT